MCTLCHSHSHSHSHSGTHSHAQYHSHAEFSANDAQAITASSSSAITSTTPLSNVYNALNVPQSWSNGLGEGAVVTYSFNGPWGSSGTSGFGRDTKPLSEANQELSREILQLFSEVANITFVEVQSGDGDIAFRNEDIDGAGGIEGYAFFPGDGVGGNITIDSSLGDAITANSFGWYTIIHEIGHAIGLDHPFLGDNSSAPKANGIPADELNADYTVLSYNGNTNDVTGLQLYDTATIQLKYGANLSHNAGNTNYGFDTATGLNQSYSLWDGGGVDTLNASNLGANVTFNLNDGDYLNTAGVEQFRIAFGAQIENAIAGEGTDTITGNELNNALYGGGSNDTIRGGDGNDAIVAGRGVTDGADGDDILYGDLGSDTLYGNSGNDILIGGRDFTDPIDGNDTLYGGLGDDQIYGNAGDDLIVGASGNDVIYGGLGNDTFVFSSGSNVDTIWGFEGAGQAGGDILRLQANLNGTDIDTFAELMAVSFTDGTHSFLATGGGNGILLLFTTLDDLAASDFVFA